MDELLIYVRAVHFAATMLAAGVVFFAAAVFNPAAGVAGEKTHATAEVRAWSRLLGWCALTLAVLSGAGWLFLTAAAMSGDKLVDVLPGGTLWIVLTETTFGHAALVRLGLAITLTVLFVPLLSAPGRASVWLDLPAAIIAAAFAGALAWSGHAAGGLGAEAAVHPAADVLHLIAAAAWVGALAPLAILLAVTGHAPDDLNMARAATLRFSLLGMAAVGTLLITGLVNSWYLVGSVEALRSSHYGKLLLLKLALFAVMAAIAAFNRAAAQTARRRLCRNAAVETLAGAAIIAIVAMLGTLAPANHAAHHSTSGAVPADAAFQHIHADQGMADVMIEPGRVGAARATIWLWNDDLETLPARSVTMILTAPAAGSKPVTQTAVQQPDAAWIVGDVQLPEAGNWTVEVDADLAGGTPLKLRAPILIDAP